MRSGLFSGSTSGTGGPVVVYIGGSGRSGSTILDMMIGGHPRALSLGQLDHLRMWVETSNVCTCGRALSACALWSRIVGGAPVSPDAVPPALNVEGQATKVVRTVALLLAANRRTGDDHPAEETWRLLQRLATLTGADVLVDSSKAALRFVRLARSPMYGDKLRLVHLVRDPRGYVASRTIAKPAPSARGFVGLTEAQPRSKAVSDWIVQNLLTYLIGRVLARDHYLVVTYEELVAEPVRTLTRVAALAGLDFEPSMLPPKSRDDYHLIGGNSARLAFTELRLDNSWRETLSPREQRIVWGLCGWLYRLLQRAGARS